MFKTIRKRLNRKGFTLVELIVVIAILGILAALVVPRFSGVLNTSRTGADESNAAMIARQIEIAFLAGDLEKDTDFKDDEKQTLANENDNIGKALIDNDYLQNIPELQGEGTGFEVTIKLNSDEDIGSITITNGSGDKLYPTE